MLNISFSPELNIDNIFIKFSYLPDFVPLIQLLVGSVFIAAFFVKPEGSFSAQLTKKLNEVLFSALQADDEVKYELVHSEENNGISPIDKRLNTDYAIIRRSVMFIMALYGAIILFYCSIFEEQTHFKDQYIPSPFGVLLMTFVIFVFLCCITYNFGRKQSSYKGLKIASGLLVISFFAFVVILPDFSLFPDDWFNILHIIANIGILFDMCFCLGIFLKKKLLLDILIKKANNIKFQLNVVSRTGVGNRLEYILSQRDSCEISHFTIWLCFMRTLLQIFHKRKPTPLKDVMTERAEVLERNRDIKRFVDIGIIVRKSKDPISESQSD